MYTGERVTAQPMLTVTMAQGAAAYRFVANLARGKTVLDLACGEGYGPDILAQAARRVVAVDRDVRTIAQASARYRRENLTFLRADVFETPASLRGVLFDVVCSFQFLEHLGEQRAFLRLLRSYVRPGGVIAVSTPNKRMFPTFNPYHLRERDAVELRALFAEEFPTARVLGIFVDAHVLQYRISKQKLGDFLLHADILRIRERLPRPVIHRVYDLVSFLLLKRISFWRHRELVTAITPENFSVRAEDLNQALDLLAIVEVAPMDGQGAPAVESPQVRLASGASSQ